MFFKLRKRTPIPEIKQVKQFSPALVAQGLEYQFLIHTKYYYVTKWSHVKQKKLFGGEFANQHLDLHSRSDGSAAANRGFYREIGFCDLLKAVGEIIRVT